MYSVEREVRVEIGWFPLWKGHSNIALKSVVSLFCQCLLEVACARHLCLVRSDAALGKSGCFCLGVLGMDKCMAVGKQFVL